MYQAGSNKGGVGEKRIEDERGGLVRWYTLTETWPMYTIGIPYIGTPQFFRIRARIGREVNSTQNSKANSALVITGYL
jgi:hypothetical protein